MNKRKIFLLLILQCAFIVTYAQESINQKDQIKYLLQEIEDLYISKLNFYERRDAIGKIDSIFEKLEYFEETTLPNGDNIDKSSTISEETLIDLKNQINSTINRNAKKNLIEALGSDVKLSVTQLYMLIEDFTWDDDKIEIIKKMYKNIVDTENSTRFLALISNSIKRDDLTEWFKER